MAHIGAMNASEDDSWAACLVLKDVIVSVDLLATTLSVAALKFNLRQEVPRNAVDLIKL